MNKLHNIVIFTLLSLLLLPSPSHAQYANKRMRSKFEAYTDSLKNIEYDRVFPFWGAKAYKQGIDIQYPLGLMANYFWTNQGVRIENFQLGFDNAHDGLFEFPLTPLPESVLSFGDNRNQSWSFNVRPDLWIFPFIDLYGIFGYGNSTTTVEVQAFPNTPQEVNFTSEVDQGIATYGFGVLLAGGVGPVWISMDNNFTWNKPELLDEATRAHVMGLRMGKLFRFQNKPQSNLSVWVGAMYLSMQSSTLGSISLRDALPDDVWDNKDQFVNNYWNWYNNEATDVQKRVADKIFTPIVDAIDNRNGESIVRYNMDKQTKQHWNGLIGLQYQINKTWQFRTEGGVIGDRKSILLSLNYRFLGFKKKTRIPN